MVSCNRHFLTQKCQAGGGAVQQNIGTILNWWEVSPLQRKEHYFPSLLLSLPPVVLVIFFSYTSAFCLFIYFGGISFSSWEAGFGYSALLLKLMLDQATSSTSCPYDKEKGKMRYSLRKRLNVGFLQRGLSRFLLFFIIISPLPCSSPTHPLLFTVALIYSTGRQHSEAEREEARQPYISLTGRIKSFSNLQACDLSHSDS